jgi:hypothetical protein
MIVKDHDAGKRARLRLKLPLMVVPRGSDARPIRCETVAVYERAVRAALRRSPTGEAIVERR